VYAIDSVDNALMIALLLQQEGALRVTDAAERLGISRSTAHRLLSMLVYRDFAVQGADRRYRPGPALRAIEMHDGPIKQLRDIGGRELRDLAALVNETANLQVRVGREVRFVASAESGHVVRVGDRTGVVLPAHLASGGRSLLATLDSDALDELYDGELSIEDLARLKKELALIRRRGLAVNDQRTEDGVVGIAVLVHVHGDPLAAVALAIPASRYKRTVLDDVVPHLQRTASRIGAALEAAI
ncbi:MAG: IclR family transcriptional regulator, partial [Nostocoides sp.]